ncbi:cyclic nucleotide-binding protein [Haloechinothrix alba]|uniref:Cyclic nucleotide-binding protein n=1 Tax=Haloechinothrix alba TaxID=664784 RepID=A0A238ZAW2_9PSEU|nr:cyclic nucleotide-binding domain-containing protein [Haloechinothrix alba]SNR80487.1 cyclic nucleotide-binding protein [Haloechinothrix alba]
MASDAPKPGSEARFLRDTGPLGDLTDRELRRIVDSASRVTLPAHWSLIQEQTPGDACYILLSGTVAVFVGTERVAELGPGDVVGEVALRQGRLRSATVSTVEPVELLHIDGADLDKLVRELPALQRAIDATAVEHGAGSSER